MEYVIQVNTKEYGWCLLCPTYAKTEAEAQNILKLIEAGEAVAWAREEYPTEDFRVATIVHEQAWWTDDNWIG